MNHWIVAHYDLHVYNIPEKAEEQQESGKREESLTLLTHEILHKTTFA